MCGFIQAERDILLCNGGSKCGLCIFSFVTDVGSLFLSAYAWFTVFRLLGCYLTHSRLSPEAIIAAE